MAVRAVHGAFTGGEFSSVLYVVGLSTLRV